MRSFYLIFNRICCYAVGERERDTIRLIVEVQCINSNVLDVVIFNSVKLSYNLLVKNCKMFGVPISIFTRNRARDFFAPLSLYNKNCLLLRLYFFVDDCRCRHAFCYNCGSSMTNNSNHYCTNCKR